MVHEVGTGIFERHLKVTERREVSEVSLTRISQEESKVWAESWSCPK